MPDIHIAHVHASLPNELFPNSTCFPLLVPFRIPSNIDLEAGVWPNRTRRMSSESQGSGADWLEEGLLASKEKVYEGESRWKEEGLFRGEISFVYHLSFGPQPSNQPSSPRGWTWGCEEREGLAFWRMLITRNMQDGCISRSSRSLVPPRTSCLARPAE